MTMAAIRSMNRQDRANLLRSMASWMTAEAQAPMLEMALDGVTGDDLAEFAIAIGKQTRFGIAAFDEPIANAARNAEFSMDCGLQFWPILTTPALIGFCFRPLISPRPTLRGSTTRWEGRGRSDFCADLSNWIFANWS